MARIAFAWELGGELGHAISCANLGRALASRGHRIALVMRELRQLAFLPEASEFDVFQAPRPAEEGRAAALPRSFTDILLGSGYARADELTALVAAWVQVLRRWRADLVVADFAPTALLAARVMGLPRISYGNGFFTPPRLAPLPPFRREAPAPREELERADATALANVNGALARLRTAPLAQLADQFATDEDILCTFPELDHYGVRPATGYWGPRIRVDRGADAEWPAGSGKRVFVYVKRDFAALDALIAALAASPHRVIAFIPELDRARRERLAGRSRWVSERPLRLDALLAQCDLLVSHGGEIAAGALMLGVPGLVLPTHYEQYLTAERFVQLGVGAWATAQAGVADLAKLIEALLATTRFVEAARAFARRYPAYSPAEQRRRVLARVEALAADALPAPQAPPILSPSPTNPRGEKR